MPARPLSLAIASGLIALIGVGVGLVGLFLLAIAAGRIPFLDGTGNLTGVVAVLGASGIAAALTAIVAAAALWQGRAWGWAASLAIAVAGVLGAVVALSTSGSQLPTQLGLLLTLAAAGLLVVPATRSAAGIG